MRTKCREMFKFYPVEITITISLLYHEIFNLESKIRNTLLYSKRARLFMSSR